MKELILKYRRPIIVLAHITLVASAYLLSFISRFDLGFFYSPEYLTLFLGTLLPLLVVRLASYWYFDLFKGLWRYVSVGDLLNIIKASALGTLLFGLYIAISGEVRVPRSIFVIDIAYNIIFKAA